MVFCNMAFLTDFHCHTNISIDAEDSMLAMAEAARAQGIDCLCITDHCDTVDWHTLAYYPPCRTVAQRVVEAYEACRDKLPEGLDLRLGMELGETLFHPELAPELAGHPGLDFVLGSLHITPEYGDYYFVKYESPEFCRHILDHYLDKLQWIAEGGHYDVLAHIGYVRRYICQQGQDEGLSLAQNGDKLEKLLKTVIESGKGIEINCSGIRDGCGAFPSPEILSLYRQLGGEIITVGSDAHRVSDAAKCIREGYEVLQNIGFRYICTYKQHQPEFHKI